MGKCCKKRCCYPVCQTGPTGPVSTVPGPTGPTGATGPTGPVSPFTTEAGWIGLPFTSAQNINPGTPTIVQLNVDYGGAFPAPTSFTSDIVGPNYGYIINVDGIYEIIYQLLLTSTSLTAAGDQTLYTSYVEYSGVPAITGLQRVAVDQTYSPFTIQGSSGVVLKGTVIVPLTAANSNVTLIVQHNSDVIESVIGPITGPFMFAPDLYQSYMQITRLDHV